ncbi:N-acetyltransferase [Companilactobacillus suantsaicola]|uniref:N-acetyltransferase n=1 Tax=Companilactobacillus suantsaicola TaxID=2487723 RepID=A0A4Z0JL18_9LACO|nr:N-acetyltransferase [Companilactobacillus suantsaicola]
MGKYRLLNILELRNGNIDISNFNCIPSNTEHTQKELNDFEMINDFVKNKDKALKYAENNIYKTFLLLDNQNDKVMGFYSLCTGSKVFYKRFKAEKGVPTIGRNKALPTIDIMWLAVDVHYQEKNIGSMLLKKICASVYDTSKTIGVCVLTVDSLFQSQKFYEKFGFMDLGSPHKKNEDLWLGLTIPEIEVFLRN